MEIKIEVKLEIRNGVKSVSDRQVGRIETPVVDDLSWMIASIMRRTPQAES